MQKYYVVYRRIDAGPDSKASKAGDPLAVLPMDTPPSEADLKNPQWQTVITEMHPSLAEALMSGPDEGQDMINKGGRRRDWQIDLSILLDMSKFDPHHREDIIEVSSEKFLEAVKQKPNPMEAELRI